MKVKLTSIFFFVLLLVSSALSFDEKLDIDANAEIQSTLGELASVSDSHEMLVALKAQASSSSSSSSVATHPESDDASERRVDGLVKLVRALQQRLQRRLRRLEQRGKHTAALCEQQVQRVRAVLAQLKQKLATRRVRLEIAQDSVMISRDKVLSLDRDAADGKQAAARKRNQLRLRRSEVTVALTRLRSEGAELRVLIRLLKNILNKLSSSDVNLAEAGAQMQSLSQQHLGARADLAALVEVAVRQVQSPSGSVADVRELIGQLLTQLRSEAASNDDELKQLQQQWRRDRMRLVKRLRALRAEARKLARARDDEAARGQAARQRVTSLKAELASLNRALRDTRAELKETRADCQRGGSGEVRRKSNLRKQLRVIGLVLKQLQNQKVSDQVIRMIRDVKLDLPVWRKGTWSNCSKTCGVGRQTRQVTCSSASAPEGEGEGEGEGQGQGKQCLGAKPRTERICHLGACHGDCVLSEWADWSPCSAQCGGGSRSRARTILSQAVGGGRACPSPMGLQQTQACNQQPCDNDTQ